MKTIRVELRRSFESVWFWLTMILTFALLWAGLGSESTGLISRFLTGDTIAWNRLLYMSLTSSTSALTLPLLSSLPCAGAALLERRTGVYRYAMFRTGRAPYCLAKVVACLVSAIVSQIVVVGCVVVFGCVFLNYSSGYVRFIDLFMSVIARFICAGVWGCLGGLISIVTKVSSSVYIAPIAISFSLSLLGRRLLPQMPFVDPERWIKGEYLYLVVVLVVVAAIAYYKVLRKEVINHA